MQIQGISSDDQFNYGRLDEERPYDNPNPTEPSKEHSGAYSNPTYVGEGNEDSNVATLPVSGDD